MVGRTRKISFPVDALFQSAIQDSDNDELSRLLVNHAGAIVIDQVNHMGLTPLLQVVLSNNLDGAKLLLCNGADVNAADVHGITPLHAAAACGFTQLASLLVVFGANVFRKNSDGDLPIDLAKDSTLIRMLSEHVLVLLQKEHYRSSWLVYHVKELWVIFLKLVLFLWTVFSRELNTHWEHMKRKQTARQEDVNKQD